ncbi:MAG: hypothetical protein WKF48_05785 [Solirubrobacteraceae bacterium]
MAAELAEGLIATAPDADARVMVTLPDFDPKQKLGPCVFTPRGTTLPSPGDPCLVAHVTSARGDTWWVLAFDA